MIKTLHKLNPTRDGQDLETRARCQDDSHPAGCFNPWMQVTFCHCGRVRYAGDVPVVRWPRPEPKRKERPVFR